MALMAVRGRVVKQGRERGKSLGCCGVHRGLVDAGYCIHRLVGNGKHGLTRITDV